MGITLVEQRIAGMINLTRMWGGGLYDGRGEHSNEKADYFNERVEHCDWTVVHCKGALVPCDGSVCICDGAVGHWD